MKKTPKTISLSALPFYWRVKDHPSDPSPVPRRLPLELTYDDELRLFKQKRNVNVLKYLSVVYQKKPNIGHNQDKSNWKDYYGNDLYRFIRDTIKKNGNKVKTILEIGCGGCAVLERLKGRKFSVLGVDPSPFSREEGAKKAIRVIQDFFPSKQIKEKFDLIYHSNVLEHIDNPLEFLKSQYEHLNTGGLLLVAVPDCTRPIENGDSSFLYHQHLSYFDENSLKTIVLLAGFSNVKVRKAKFGGNLYCESVKSVRNNSRKNLFFRKSSMTLSTFLNKHNVMFTRFAYEITGVLRDPEKTLGFYAPLRALPYISEMHLRNGFRFFDDTNYWHKKYFDGLDVPFENFNDFKRNPVTDIFIMSPTFGKMITDKIKNTFGKKVRIHKITDFYAKSAK